MASTGARSGWQCRPLLAASLRVAATLAPVVVSLAVAVTLNRVLPPASDTIVAIGRSLGLAMCSLGALVVTDAVARRFLPLAALLQLSLVFPDQTPSRFRTALKGGSGRRLAREVELARRQGISDDPSRAAEQLLMLATAMGDHDRRTRGHSERVRLYTELIAEELNMSPDERAKLQWAALIHDIGKIEVPPAILNKKGRPDANEWVILQGHPLVGERLAAPVEPWLGDAVHAIGGHHERWDGTGYPRGLAGAEIPRAAAIVSVADAFEVMTAVRSYKAAMPLAEARAELTRCAGTHFSPEVVRALLNVSIGRLRRSMGLIAAVAHVPLLGQATKVAAYAPDTVSTAVGFTTSTATAGVGVLAVAGALAVASPSPVTSDALPSSVAPYTSVELIASETVQVASGVAADVEMTVVSTTPVPEVSGGPTVPAAVPTDASISPDRLDAVAMSEASPPLASEHADAGQAQNEGEGKPGDDTKVKSDKKAADDGEAAKNEAKSDAKAQADEAKAQEAAARAEEARARDEAKAQEAAARAEEARARDEAKAQEAAARAEEARARDEAKTNGNEGSGSDDDDEDGHGGGSGHGGGGDDDDDDDDD